MTAQTPLFESVQDALRRWHAQESGSPLASLQVIRSLVKSDLSPHTTAHATPHAIVNQLLLNLINQMERQQPELAEILKLRFIEEMNVLHATNRLNMSQATLFRRQKEAIIWLTAQVAAEENEAQAAHISQMEARLEAPSYEESFGLGAHLDQLQELLDRRDQPWLVLLTGLGGIGKTTVADALLRRMIRSSQFDDFAWTTARQQQFQLDGTIVPVTNPALTPDALLDNLANQLLEGAVPAHYPPERLLELLSKRLKAHPHLVVVDNLETVQDVMALLPVLRQMANPSKFLLTSRQSIPGAAYLYQYPVPALELIDALALVRYEAATRNLPHLVNARDAELHPIFETVGGNPLALRLVVGQTRHHPLPIVLEKLTAARGTSIEALFSFIYRQAWDMLDEDAQQLLLCMPLVPEAGAERYFLATISGLAPAALDNALESLLRLSLVDNRSRSLRDSRYTIHSLTRAFLLEQVIRWQA